MHPLPPLPLATPALLSTSTPRPVVRPARRPGRALHVVDPENGCGSADVTSEQVVDFRDRYVAGSGYRAGDLMVVGSSRLFWQVGAFAWGLPAEWKVQDGPEGGELAALESVGSSRLWNVSRVVIGSGDHRFAELASRACAAGLQVEVVARRGSLSTALRRACGGNVTLLPALVSVDPFGRTHALAS